MIFRMRKSGIRQNGSTSSVDGKVGEISISRLGASFGQRKTQGRDCLHFHTAGPGPILSALGLVTQVQRGVHGTVVSMGSDKDCTQLNLKGIPVTPESTSS